MQVGLKLESSIRTRASSLSCSSWDEADETIDSVSAFARPCLMSSSSFTSIVGCFSIVYFSFMMALEVSPCLNSKKVVLEVEEGAWKGISNMIKICIRKNTDFEGSLSKFIILFPLLLSHPLYSPSCRPSWCSTWSMKLSH